MRKGGFTLLEALVVIAIVAALGALIIPWVFNYVRSAKYHADHQTLTVLNDAITRYKCEGGNVSALTAGMDYTNLLTRLRTPVGWCGFDHQFLTSQGQYDKAQTVVSTGSGRTFRLTQYDTYSEETGGSYSLGGGAGGNPDAVVAGGYHTLFLKADGSLWGVGYNSEGGLGDGTTTDRTSPVQAATGVIACAAGMSHSLFVKTDGTLWAMGANWCGQLGVATGGADRTSPVQVATGVAACATGDDHSLFVKTDGSLWAMGNNSFGQLGDGTTANRNPPVQVATGVATCAGGGNAQPVCEDRWQLVGNGRQQLWRIGGRDDDRSH